MTGKNIRDIKKTRRLKKEFVLATDRGLSFIQLNNNRLLEENKVEVYLEDRYLDSVYEYKRDKLIALLSVKQIKVINRKTKSVLTCVDRSYKELT
jgi:hypothetical protein